MQNDNVSIDVENILKSKAPGKYKYIPRFVISYLKRIVHQDEVNYFLNDYAKGKVGVDFLDYVLSFLERWTLWSRGVRTCRMTVSTLSSQTTRSAGLTAWR